MNPESDLNKQQRRLCSMCGQEWHAGEMCPRCRIGVERIAPGIDRAWFEPGDGCRYEALFVRLDARVELQELGAVHGGHLVTLGWNGRSYLLARTAPTLACAYVRAKFGLEAASTAECYTHLIGRFLGREIDVYL